MEEGVVLIKPVWKKRSEETTKTHISWLLTHSEVGTIFIGTSMFERFDYTPEGKYAFKKYLSQFNIFNCGVGGDRISNIIYRLQELKVLDNVKTSPKHIVLLAGANDIEKGRVEEMAQGMKQLLDIINKRFRQSHVSLLGVFPRRSDKINEDMLHQNCLQFNIMLEKEAESREYVSYHYFGNDVIDERGYTQKKYFVDNVHFSAKGYDLFGAHLKTLLEK